MKRKRVKKLFVVQKEYRLDAAYTAVWKSMSPKEFEAPPKGMR